ncbi:pseudaminic acid CMP-transferase [Candidatus Magnetomorum sp. HK-1]|nr:pseudaminic acid CMP-transferase [Candidatus Magnetomorum sp. HK-1]
MPKLAIIPARAGSKRIPKKNIKLFCGKPIIAYSIEEALKSECFDEIMVSTDDEEIVNIAHHYQASVPFMRDPSTSTDHAGIMDVVLEVVQKYKNELNLHYDYVCCILATAPFVTAQIIQSAYQILIKKNVSSVFPIVRYSYPIQRSLKLKDNRTKMLWPENYNKRSQDLEPVFHDAGIFYWLNLSFFPGKDNMFDDNAVGIELPEIFVQDIDTLSDWEIAEFKYQYFCKKGFINHTP